MQGTIDEPFITAQALTASQIKHMYETGKKALQNHTASKISGISGADDYQQIYGTTNIVTAVTVDEQNSIIYVGTSDNANGGGVSAIGLYTDTIEDAWATGISKLDDDGTAWGAEDIVSIGVTGRYPSTIAIATDAEFWVETEEFSFDKYRSLSTNPHGSHLVQTDLTIQNDLTVGDSFVVWGRVAGDAVAPGDPIAKAAFRVALDGTVSVREDIVLKGGVDMHTISGINDVFVYDTTKDADGGAWTNDTNAKATSWYNESIDATSQTCDPTVHDRCGARPFPQKAVITATDGALYIFDAKDNTLWLKFEDASGYALPLIDPSAVFELNGVVYVAGPGCSDDGLYAVDFINDKIARWDDDAYDASSSGIDGRNSSNTFTEQNASYEIVSDDVNDVHAAVICGGDLTYNGDNTDKGGKFAYASSEAIEADQR